MNSQNRIPTTLLCGYLGAGKTTLINHLLASDHGVRMAVLVNDFGAVNIDAGLIENQTDQTISLTNGCVCCSISDDLGGAIEAQVLRQDAPDHILIEASGVAEPGRVVNYVDGWPGVLLDSIITVVDLETVRERANDKFVGRVVRRQISAGDLIVLNKTDLIDVDTRASLKEWIGDLAPRGALVDAQHSEIDPNLVFGPRFERAVMDEGPPEDIAIRFETEKWIPPCPVDLSALEVALDSIPSTVHRLKGFVRDRETGGLLLVQVVGRRRTISKADQRSEECIVAIGASKQDIDLIPGLLSHALYPPEATG